MVATEPVSAFVSCFTETLQATALPAAPCWLYSPHWSCKFTKLHGNLISAAALGPTPAESEPAAAEHICDDLQPDTHLPPCSFSSSLLGPLHPCFGSACYCSVTSRIDSLGAWGLWSLSQTMLCTHPGAKQYLEIVNVFYFIFCPPSKGAVWPFNTIKRQNAPGQKTICSCLALFHLLALCLPPFG